MNFDTQIMFMPLEIIIKPRSFFRGKFGELNTIFALIFGILFSCISILFTAGMIIFLQSNGIEPMYILGGEFKKFSLNNTVSYSHEIFVFLTILFLFLVPLWLLVKAIIIHCGLIFSGSDYGRFRDTFKVVCFSTPTKLASVIPAGGLLLALVWDVFIIIRGLQEAHRVPFGYAASAAMVPALLLILF